MSITKALKGVSANCWYPGFKSTQAKARSWDSRVETLVKAFGKPDVLLLQEIGRDGAADLFGRLGSKYSYQRFGPLNAVGWNTDRLPEFVSTLEVELSGYGQTVPGYSGSGRGAPVVKLRDADGNRIRLASTHFAVKTPSLSADAAKRGRVVQTKQFCGAVNDDIDDWPIVLGADINSRVTDSGRNPRDVFDDYGWIIQNSGIDILGTNFGAKVSNIKSLELDSGSDHNGHTFSLTTTKK